MEGVYNLDKAPASFNFMDFLVAAKTYGATEIVLDDTRGHRNKFSPEETAARMQNIVEPACALVGLPYRYDVAHKDAINCGYGLMAPLKAYKRNGRLEKMKSVKEPVKNKYTVTLRNSYRHPHRNSSGAWRKFAEAIGAYVIEDYYDKPIHLHDRVALYAGADLNYFGSNGPASIAMYSDYPYTIVIPRNEGNFLNPKYCIDNQLPWANKNQKIVISPDEEEFFHQWWPEGVPVPEWAYPKRKAA